MTQDVLFMHRCLALAKQALGNTYPNPMVGSVVVVNNQIIGEGWHQKAGTPHAEVHAIGAVADVSLLKQATLYVSLEPCSHHGRTPPCADLIIKSGIQRVVVATLDPNPLVAGQGIQRLRDVGIEVVVGVLEAEARYLNRRFFTFHEQKRPYVVLKWAQSEDGFMAPAHQEMGQPFWLTGTLSRLRVHQWRTQEAAILVGTQTVLADNPSLTARDWAGNQPLRIFLDATGKVPAEFKLRTEPFKTLVFTQNKNYLETDFLKREICTFDQTLWTQLFHRLWELGISSVLIEGGRHTLQSIIDAQIWDEARIFTAPKTIHNGIPAPAIQGENIYRETIENDQLVYLHPYDYDYHF
jgi:diaminohydroxyphosphoribosylaminopyrimidine deaminase/5-amino-6-(5-phosphoribosylamino)uracil reductase